MNDPSGFVSGSRFILGLMYWDVLSASSYRDYEEFLTGLH